ncbi:MAG: DegT/DnrJ/EryC1/StrS family aminotransferase [Oligoflexia bacterium]|nr:DegT/DnrJ/EryC1/StrS family aminotransferase [Oligoflexia bacterium]
MKFPFFDLTRQYQTLKEEVEPVILKIFEKQAFVMGDEVSFFERDVAKYIGVKHAITCSSGTDALVLALKALGIKPGDEVLTTPYSFFASTSAILLCEARPVFVDIKRDGYNLDPTKLEGALTKKTKGILPVHLFGQCADMEAILAFAKKHNLFVLEDAAQSIGAKYASKSAGSMGDMGAVSFYPTKNLGGAGEGGLVTTNDDVLAEKAKLLRVHGMKVRYTHDVLGWNSRHDATKAAYLRIKLKYLDGWVKQRALIAKRYSDEFSQLEKAGKLQLPRQLDGNHHVWNQFTILIENRDVVRKNLEEKGIPTDIYYPKTIPAQPVLKELGYGDIYSEAKYCADRALALPIFPELTESEQAQVIDALKKEKGSR